MKRESMNDVNVHGAQNLFDRNENENAVHVWHTQPKRKVSQPKFWSRIIF